jgi:hypothetical protein
MYHNDHSHKGHKQVSVRVYCEGYATAVAVGHRLGNGFILVSECLRGFISVL